MKKTSTFYSVKKPLTAFTDLEKAFYMLLKRQDIKQNQWVIQIQYV